MTLTETLAQIKANRARAPYTVTTIGGLDGVYVGLDSEDRPCIFISTDSKEQIPSIRTSRIRVEFSKKYVLLLGDGTRREGQFHGILCLSDDPTDIRTFTSVVDSMLSELGSNITIDSITSIFHSLVNLFSIGPSPEYVTERRGLWAELYFMQQCGGFRIWAPSWHSEPTRLFDFSTGNVRRTEIKSTIRPERRHEFSHAQLMALPNEHIRVVSFMLQEDDAGLSLKSLISTAREELFGNPNYIKLERAIRSVGMDNSEEDGPKFDANRAKQNMAWFRSTDVPRYDMPEPENVSGTHHQSNLTSAPQLSPQEIEDWIRNWNDLVSE